MYPRVQLHSLIHRYDAGNRFGSTFEGDPVRRDGGTLQHDWGRATLRFFIVRCLLAMALVAILVAGCAASPSKSSKAASGCVTFMEPVHAREPHDVVEWAQGKPVIGEGSLWTIRSAVRVPGVKYGNSWHLKFPWYTRPNGLLRVEGRRLDGPGTFHYDVNRAFDARGPSIRQLSISRFRDAGKSPASTGPRGCGSI